MDVAHIVSVHAQLAKKKSHNQAIVNGLEMHNPPTKRGSHSLNNHTPDHVSNVSGLSNWWIVVATVT